MLSTFRQSIYVLACTGRQNHDEDEDSKDCSPRVVIGNACVVTRYTRQLVLCHLFFLDPVGSETSNLFWLQVTKLSDFMTKDVGGCESPRKQQGKNAFSIVSLCATMTYVENKNPNSDDSVDPEADFDPIEELVERLKETERRLQDGGPEVDLDYLHAFVFDALPEDDRCKVAALVSTWKNWHAKWREIHLEDIEAQKQASEQEGKSM